METSRISSPQNLSFASGDFLSPDSPTASPVVYYTRHYSPITAPEAYTTKESLKTSWKDHLLVAGLIVAAAAVPLAIFAISRHYGMTSSAHPTMHLQSNATSLFQANSTTTTLPFCARFQFPTQNATSLLAFNNLKCPAPKAPVMNITTLAQNVSSFRL